MAKKRKSSGRNAQPGGPKELDAADARLGPITTYEDVADSEEEYFINRDKIMLEDEPGSKRRKQDEDDMELSDEEVLGYDDDDSDDDDDELDQRQPSKSKKAAFRSNKDAMDEDQEEGEDEQDSGWWGSSKNEYYNADNIQTEADAEEEEAEAKRLQQKKLSKMAEEDFLFDGDEWLASKPAADEGDDTITEVLKDVEITDDMSLHERSKILATRYPEFEYLVSDFQELQPQLSTLQKAAEASSGTSPEAIKYWILGCYVAALASYFAILTSPARDSLKLEKSLDPAELRDHEVMETLVSCRTAWDRVKSMKSLSAVKELSAAALGLEETDGIPFEERTARRDKKMLAKKDKATAARAARRLEKAKAIESTVADLYDLPIGISKPKKSSKALPAQTDDNSDFGEEDALDARTAADKAARKKSLKFYTSQITQKANKRAGAGRDAGGDMDIPHRERLRDRQARLLREAEKRGLKTSKLGADLGDNSDDEDTTTAKAVRNDEDEYYDMVANSSKNKREDKAARYAAYAAASKADRVVENEEVGEDGKRKITYAIEKNKGLAPKRNKDVRNPRVKKRKQYEAKKKKLASMKPIWKGGEPKGGYQGELSGINTGVIKSVKL